MNRINRNTRILDEIDSLCSETGSQVSDLNLKCSMDRAENEIIRTALQTVEWNMEEAASVLGISVASLYRKINKHNIR